MTDKEKHNAYLRKRRNEKIEAGICITCPAPPLPNQRQCAKCQKRQREFSRKHAAKRAEDKPRYEQHLANVRAANKKRWAERRALGLCLICGEPAKEGFVKCEKHMEAHRLACRKTKAAAAAGVERKPGRPPKIKKLGKEKVRLTSAQEAEEAHRFGEGKIQYITLPSNSESPPPRTRKPKVKSTGLDPAPPPPPGESLLDILRNPKRELSEW